MYVCEHLRVVQTFHSAQRKKIEMSSNDGTSAFVLMHMSIKIISFELVFELQQLASRLSGASDVGMRSGVCGGPGCKKTER